MQASKHSDFVSGPGPSRARSVTRKLTAKVLTFYSQFEGELLKLLRQRLLDCTQDPRGYSQDQIANWHTARRFFERDSETFNASFLTELEKAMSDEILSLQKSAQNSSNQGGAINPNASRYGNNSRYNNILDSLSLVEADEMDRMVTRDRVIQRFNAHYEEVIGPLNQRMRVLLNAELVGISCNPYRPEIFIRAFSKALEANQFETAAIQDILLTVDPKYWIDLAPLYASLDESVLDLGVDAQPHRVRKAAGADSGAAWTPGASTHSGVQSGYGTTGFGTSAYGRFPGDSGPPSRYGAPAPSTGHSRYSDFANSTNSGYSQPAWVMSSHAQAREFLHRLISRRQALYPGASAPGAPSMPAESSGSGAWSGYAPGVAPMPLEPYLISCLEELQVRAIEAMSLGGLDLDLGDQNVLHDLRFTDQFRRAQDLDRGTVDALAEVFDFVFNDPAIPPPLKVIIGRLQIPVLKAAMLDREFFFADNHPARRLIDALSAAALAWTEDKGVQDPLYVHIEYAVKRVLNEFSEDLALFGEVLLEFEEFLAEADRQADHHVEKVAQDQEHDEALALAREHADQTLHERISTMSLEESTAALLVPFLTQQWREVLAQAYLQQATRPDDCAHLVATTDQLIWSTLHKSDADQRRQLITMLPTLVRQLNASLDKIGWRGEEREMFTRRLIATHMNALRSTVDESVDVGPNVYERQATEAAVRALDERLDAAQTNEAHGSNPVLQDMERGMWFDYMDDSGQVLRCRLTWISPRRSRFLFTNREGFDAFVRSAAEVTELLARSRLKILNQEPIVARALGQIMGSARPDALTSA